MAQQSYNKRKFERYDLQVPAQVDFGDSATIEFCTRDISASGAYLYAAQPLQEGVKVTLDIILSNEHMERITGAKCRIRVQGMVVRCDTKGMAVNFSGHEIMHAGSMMDN